LYGPLYFKAKVDNFENSRMLVVEITSRSQMTFCSGGQKTLGREKGLLRFLSKTQLVRQQQQQQQQQNCC
jgi:hypothetical protein